MVSNASDDFPEPDSPVKTVRVLRGISRSMFLRLCCLAPRMTILSFIVWRTSSRGRTSARKLEEAVAESLNLVSELGGLLELKPLGMLEHLLFQFLDVSGQLLVAHALHLLEDAGLLYFPLRRPLGPDHLVHPLLHRLRGDAVLFVVGYLDGAAAVGLVDGPLHGAGDLVV